MSVVALGGAMVLSPLLAAAAGLVVGRRSPRAVVPVAVAGTALALVVAAALAVDAATGARLDSAASYAEVTTGSVPVHVALHVDGLAAVVAVAVATVALLVQVYSSGYLAGDPRYPSYAAAVSLFTSAMLLVVVADDLVVLLVGWEVMGLCSYLLIGHHWEQEDARTGATKALVVTRLGDVGFLVGIFVLGLAAGTFRIGGVDAAAGRLDATTATVGTLLLLAGVAGKSAQFPLQTWLPDAMAGPTPVSALIHAATMVAAGIYLVARLQPVFLAAPATLAVMAVVAAVTMLGAALAALAQRDIKRVLAWSTVSQLAYMLGGLAVGAAGAAVFHLLSHAAFKALLFLAAGAVITAVGTNVMADMAVAGGLRRVLPLTFVTFTVGLAALAGVPPTSGFFSKEAVLSAAEESALHDGPVAPWAAWLVLVVGLLTVAVTAAYAVRAWLLTFFADPVLPAGGPPPHEAPAGMRWPLVVLAVPALLLGLLGLRDGDLARWLGLDEPPIRYAAATTVLSMLLSLAGAAAVLAVWRRAPRTDPADRLRGRRGLVEGGFGVDAAYARAVVRPVRALARGVRWTDREVLGAYLRGSGAAARGLGGLLRRTQTGYLPGYLAALLAGFLLLVAVVAVA